MSPTVDELTFRTTFLFQTSHVPVSPFDLVNVPSELSVMVPDGDPDVKMS
jgi:hypothetical protein